MKDTLGAKGTAQGPVGNSSRSPSSAAVHRVKGIQSVGSGEHREFWLLFTDLVVVPENLIKKVTTNKSLGSFHLEANIYNILGV